MRPQKNNQDRRGGREAQQRRPTPVVTSSKASDAVAVKKFMELISLDVNIETARSLDVRGKGLTFVPRGLSSVLVNIRKLDLSGNNIADLAPLSSFPQLSNLNVSGNAALQNLRTLSCSKLVVFAAANCGLISLKGLETSAATLRTLIANDNAIQLQSPPAQRADPSLPERVRLCATDDVAVENYEVLGSLTACETVVLTRNASLCALYPATDTEASEGGREDAEEEDEAARAARQHATKVLAAAHPLSVMERLAQLKKLSISECGLNCLPARWFLPLVVELRLAKNALHSLRPEGVIVRSLKTLDVSHNQLTTIATLRRCRFVQRLNLRGNPLVNVYVERDREEAQGSDEEKDASAQPASDVAAVQGVPVSLQRGLKRLLEALEAVDGQPLLSSEKLVRRRRSRPHKDSDDDEPTAAAAEGQAASPATKKARPERANKHSSDGVPPATREEVVAKVRAEAEEKDAVAEAPASVVKESHVPIIRRERAVAPPSKKNVVVSGGAAVAQLLKQKKETQGW